jgi:hypothetical protein
MMVCRARMMQRMTIPRGPRGREDAVDDSSKKEGAEHDSS